MRRQLLTLGITASILLSLLVFAQPTAAVLSTVDGPDEFRQSDEVSFGATIELRQDERVPIESFELRFSPTGTSGAVTVVFAPDGTLESVHTSGDAAASINVSRLEETLVIGRTAGNADFGYGYLSGTNERTSEEHTFGYGYGYGYGYGAQPTFGFDISFDSSAFAPGNYTLRLSVNADEDDGAFDSNLFSFEVLPARAPADVDVDPDTLNQASNGQWVTAYIELPDHDVTDVDIDTVELNGVPAVNDSRYGFVADPAIKDRDGDGLDELMVKFPRDEVADTLEPGDDVTVTVTGVVGDTTFTASDTIRVIDRGGPPDDAGPGDASAAGSADEDGGTDEAAADDDDDEADGVDEGGDDLEANDEDEAEEADDASADDDEPGRDGGGNHGHGDGPVRGNGPSERGNPH